jgi:hypothetical protein
VNHLPRGRSATADAQPEGAGLVGHELASVEPIGELGEDVLQSVISSQDP